MKTDDQGADCTVSIASNTRRHFPLAVGVIALMGGYLIGSQPGSVVLGQENPAKVAKMLEEKELVPINVDIPTVTVNKEGWAIVGAADGLYYLVREDATAVEIKVDRRNDLMWR